MRSCGGARALAPWLWIMAVVACPRARAAAQEAASTLSLVAPDSCPSGDVLHAELAGLVGRPIEEISLPQGLDPQIAITALGDRLVLVVRDAEGARTLRDTSCAALVRAAALIIALRIDADAATLAAAQESESESESEGESQSEDETPRARPHRARYDYDALEWSGHLPSPQPPRALPVLAIGAGVLVEGGAVPAASASFAADVVLRADRFEARVRGAYVLEQAQPTLFGVAASAVLATALACGRPFEADFAIAFCAGVEGGPLFARSYGVNVTGASTAWTVAGVLGVWLPLFPWLGMDISLGAEAWGRFDRPDFQIMGRGSVWDADPFGGRFALLVHFSP